MQRLMCWLVLIAMTINVHAKEPHWNQFRGGHGDGKAVTANPPVDIGEDKNVKWKIPMPGKAWSSPVVWEDQIWLTNAPEDGKKLSAVCVDANTGKVIHDILVFDNPNPPFCIPKNSYASCTPIVEAGRVYLHYGSMGTACVDTKTGKTIWSRRDIECDHFRAPASSPIIYNDLLIMLFDGADVQFVMAVDKLTGKTVWKTDRTINFGTDNGDRKKAYCTPSVITHNGQEMLICPAAIATEALDPKTGKLLWTVYFGGMNASARPLYHDGHVVVTNGMGGMTVIKPDGSGDITKSAIAWSERKGVAKKSSQILIGNDLYMISDSGVGSCRDLKTGKVYWDERLGRGAYAASPILASNRIYFFSESGSVVVIKAGREPKILSQGKFDDGFMASPAVIGDALILRTKSHLYRVEE